MKIALRPIFIAYALIYLKDICGKTYFIYLLVKTYILIRQFIGFIAHEQLANNETVFKDLILSISYKA